MVLVTALSLAMQADKRKLARQRCDKTVVLCTNAHLLGAVRTLNSSFLHELMRRCVSAVSHPMQGTSKCATAKHEHAGAQAI